MVARAVTDTGRIDETPSAAWSAPAALSDCRLARIGMRTRKTAKKRQREVQTRTAKDKIRQAHVLMDSIESRLERLSQSATASAPPVGAISRSRDALLADTAKVQKILQPVQVGPECRRQHNSAMGRARKVTKQVNAFAQGWRPTDPSRKQPPGALLPPRPLPPLTPGPDSPNYYQDPVNSK
jgi:hypothetical protein